MGSKELKILKKGVQVWNKWREENPDITQPDLMHSILRNRNLAGINFQGVGLIHADLQGANLSGANIANANLLGINLHAACLEGTNLSNTTLCHAIMYDCNLNGANLTDANLTSAFLDDATFENATFTNALLANAKLNGCNLRGANLEKLNMGMCELNGSNLSNANLNEAMLLWVDLSHSDMRGATLSGTWLSYARLNGANLSGAVLENCHVHGVSTWDLDLTDTKQKNLIISRTGPNESKISVVVDNLEFAHFVYLILEHKKIRDLIQTIGQKAVLILGRFSPERKAVLDAIAEKIRSLGLMPIIFDFDKPDERDFTETVMILAGLSLFVIADITSPKSSPLELQATIPNYMIPFAPIIHEGEKPFAMFEDLQKKHDCVLPPLAYDTPEKLVAVLEQAIIGPAMQLRERLLKKKNSTIAVRHVSDYE